MKWSFPAAIRRGREDYAGTPEEWKHAEDALKSTLDRMNVPYKYIPGEAAFYGPKIDVKLVDAIGRPWQLTTVQFDFNLPRRFDLEYVGEDGDRHMPLMVHRALWGSVERFFGVLIEHYAGAFPAWLAPVQATRAAGERKIQRVCAEGGGQAEGSGTAHASGRSQRKAAGENPRRADREDSLHADHRRQRSGGGDGLGATSLARATWGRGRSTNSSPTFEARSSQRRPARMLRRESQTQG